MIIGTRPGNGPYGSKIELLAAGTMSGPSSFLLLLNMSFKRSMVYFGYELKMVVDRDGALSIMASSIEKA